MSELSGGSVDAAAVAANTAGVATNAAGVAANAAAISSLGSIGLLSFGAKSDQAGKLLQANGTSNVGDESTKQKTRHPVFAGDISKIAYQTKLGDLSTYMKIHVNGVVQATVQLANINVDKSGVEEFASWSPASKVSVSDGDRVELEWDAGQKPDECIFTVYVEHS